MLCWWQIRNTYVQETARDNLNSFLNDTQGNIYAYIYFHDILASINPGPHGSINQTDKHQKPTNLKTRLFFNIKIFGVFCSSCFNDKLR